MNIEIKKLTPNLAEDYVRFFDVTPHDDHTVKAELPCYCVTWRSDDSYVGNDHWYSAREERREKALEFVKNGYLQGYLAYHDGKIVGWCNANANCKMGISYLREFWPIEEYDDQIKVKPVFCFMIAPEMQGKGVASQLLERVCSDAAEDGFDYVEAYANKEIIDYDFRGPVRLYEKCGFHQYAERDGRVVMRKELK